VKFLKYEESVAESGLHKKLTTLLRKVTVLQDIKTHAPWRIFYHSILEQIPNGLLDCYKLAALLDFKNGPAQDQQQQRYYFF
jgi:hypothetical protein